MLKSNLIGLVCLGLLVGGTLLGFTVLEASGASNPVAVDQVVAGSAAVDGGEAATRSDSALADCGGQIACPIMAEPACPDVCLSSTKLAVDGEASAAASV